MLVFVCVCVCLRACVRSCESESSCCQYSASWDPGINLQTNKGQTIPIPKKHTNKRTLTPHCQTWLLSGNSMVGTHSLKQQHISIYCVQNMYISSVSSTAFQKVYSLQLFCLFTLICISQLFPIFLQRSVTTGLASYSP